jgi:phenylacetate-CoA ligase
VAVYRSHLSWAHAHANVFRAWHWHGLDVGDRYAYLWGLPFDPAGRRKASMKDWLFNRERCSAFELGPERARRFYDHLRTHPVHFAFGYPSAVTKFADEIQSLGLDGRALRLKAAITTAEVLHDHQRERIGAAFGCRVVDSYGCAEAGVAGFECEAGGMHVPIESVAVDVVPGDNGACEVLLTDLHNYSQPMIRYRVGDLIGAARDTCACGRSLPLLGRIQGRAGEDILLPNGRRVNGLLPYYVFRPYAMSGLVREYQFVQFPGGAIELRILPGDSWTDEASYQVRGQITRELGVPVDLKVVTVIRRLGRGKHRDFVKAEDLEE